MSGRPIIGITSYAQPAKWAAWELPAALVPLMYVEAVTRAGGRALLVPPDDAAIDETLDVLDGLIFSGGADVDPASYGAERGPETDEPHVHRDSGEMALLSAALERDLNTVKDYDIGAALRLATLKLVGYTEVVHALLSRLSPDASIVIYGGLAKLRPYPGSTTVTTVNAAVDGLVRTLAAELPPIRVNALHPGIVGDSPFWASKAEALEAVKARTPTGRLVQMRDVTDAALFLLENPSMHGGEIRVDGGWSLS